jgi:hypothetical protein
MPTSPLLQRLFEIENFDPEVSNQLKRRVKLPVTSGSAQAPDFARTEALLVFDDVGTKKRTPLVMDVGVDVQVEGRPSASTIEDLSRIEQRLLAGACYALLRMRSLPISWAEYSVVVSCGKVDYDKSG